MRSNILSLVLMCVAILTAAVIAQPTPPPESAPPRRPASLAEARQAIDAVMQKIGNDEMAGAFELLREQITLPEEEFKRLQSAAMKTRNEASKLGKLLGAQFIRQDVINEVMARFTYVQKFERSLIVWQFYFYHPTDHWMLHGFKWSVKPEVLFEDIE